MPVTRGLDSDPEVAGGFMGTDIHGAIECRPQFGLPKPPAWACAMDLELIYATRNYDAFGCLFGITNFAGFDPVAAGRGLAGPRQRRWQRPARSLVRQLAPDMAASTCTWALRRHVPLAA